MGAVSHVKSNTIGDFTGTVTVFNSAGTTTTAAATDLVRPADWNSAHAQLATLSGNTLGQSTVSGTNIVFAGGNNVTLSASQGTNPAATISFVGPAAGSEGVSNLGNTSGTTGMVANGQAIFIGGNNVTLSQSLNGSTVSITFSAGGATLSSYEPYPMHNTGTGAIAAATATSQSASFFPFIVNEYVSAGMLALAASLSFVTMGTSSGQQSATHAFAIYSRGAGANSTSLGTVASTSFGLNVTYNNSTISISQPTTSAYSGYGALGSTSSNALALTSGYTGVKMIQVPINVLLTPGQYWLGIHARESTNSNSGGIKVTYIGNQMTLSAMAPIGSFTTAYTSGTNLVGQLGGPWVGPMGVATAGGTTTLPAALAISDLSANLSVMPYMRFNRT